jgi:hypothetical protein
MLEAYGLVAWELVAEMLGVGLTPGRGSVSVAAFGLTVG